MSTSTRIHLRILKAVLAKHHDYTKMDFAFAFLILTAPGTLPEDTPPSLVWHSGFAQHGVLEYIHVLGNRDR
jgi:hypothetical protein